MQRHFQETLKPSILLPIIQSLIQKIGSGFKILNKSRLFGLPSELAGCEQRAQTHQLSDGRGARRLHWNGHCVTIPIRRILLAREDPSILFSSRASSFGCISVPGT